MTPHLRIIFSPNTAWLNIHALTLKRNTEKYYFDEKSSFLNTFLKISCESRKIKVKLQNILISKKETLMYGKLAMTCFKYQVFLYGSEAITYVNASYG